MSPPRCRRAPKHHGRARQALSSLARRVRGQELSQTCRTTALQAVGFSRKRHAVITVRPSMGSYGMPNYGLYRGMRQPLLVDWAATTEGGAIGLCCGRSTRRRCPDRLSRLRPLGVGPHAALRNLIASIGRPSPPLPRPKPGAAPRAAGAQKRVLPGRGESDRTGPRITRSSAPTVHT